MNRRQFLVAGSLVMPAAALAGPDGPPSHRGLVADLPLLAPEIRLEVLHCLAPPDAARNMVWLRQALNGPPLRQRPHALLLPERALTGRPDALRTPSAESIPAVDGTAVENLARLAREHDCVLLVVDWWRDRSKILYGLLGVAPHAAPRLAPVTTGEQPALLPTGAGNWALLPCLPDQAAARNLSRAGAEWLLAPASSATAAHWDAPVLAIAMGRARPAPPPGCPDLHADLTPLQTRLLGPGADATSCSRGNGDQALAIRAPLAALRAVRRTT